MKDSKSGFTLVEVSLFLAVTALLFLGVTIGVRSSVFQQRYNDSVQNFAEFLRSVYSESTNVEHIGTGRSDQAIYGKMITFGETYDLSGKKIEGDEDRIFSYTVVGDVGDMGTGGNVLDTLKKLKANVAIKEGSAYKLAGIPQVYIPRWGANIQTTDAYSGGYKRFVGTVLIVRHPSSGTVYTFFSKNTIQVNNILRTGVGVAELLTSKLSTFGASSDVDFCVNPLGKAKSDTRRDVRLIKNARNASGVELINQDGTENRCK